MTRDCSKPFDPTIYTYVRFKGTAEVTDYVDWTGPDQIPGTYEVVSPWYRQYEDKSNPLYWDALFLGSAQAANPNRDGYATEMTSFLCSSEYTDSEGTTEWVSTFTNANMSITPCGNDTAKPWVARTSVSTTGYDWNNGRNAQNRIHIGEIGKITGNRVSSTPFPYPAYGGFPAVMAVVFADRTQSGLSPTGRASITGVWEFSYDQQTIEDTWSGLDEDGNDIDCPPDPDPDGPDPDRPEPPVTEPPDDCTLLSYNPTWLVDGCPRLIAIPGPDKTPPPLVGGSPSPSPSPPPFNPYKYRYVRFVGKGSRTGGLDGIGLSDGNPGTFVGYYIDNDGNISTPWTELEAGDYRYVGTLWNYQIGTGGGKDFIYDSVVNTTDGFDEFEFGGTRITSWTPAVNFYDNLEPIIEGGPQIGTGHGVPWRSQVSVTTNGLAGGYGDFNGYIGDLGSKSKVARPSYTFPSLPDFAVRDALSIRNLSSSPDGLYPYKEAPITLTIKGHWEFSNNAIDIDAIWAGLDE